MSERKIMIDLSQLSAKCKLYQNRLDASRGVMPQVSTQSFQNIDLLLILTCFRVLAADIMVLPEAMA